MTTDLLVIDVQDFFATAARVVNETLNEIRLAKKRKANIFVVEYVNCGSSNQRIIKALKGYSKAHFITKYGDGGGKEILGAMEGNGISPSKFRIVGVNRSYCIWSTISELLSLTCTNTKIMKLKVSVSEKGTWCEEPEAGLDMLKNQGCSII